MWNPIREILTRYKVSSANEKAYDYFVNETADFFSKPVDVGGYGMDRKRVEFLLGEYSRLLKEKKINPLYYDMPWSQVVTMAKKFDAIVKNDKWVFTFYDGINRGLVNALLFNPESQKFESWKLVDTERGKEKGFDPLRDVRDYITGIFGETFMQLLPYALIVLVFVIIFYKVKK
jgi:hypothetical protein